MRRHLLMLVLSARTGVPNSGTRARAVPTESPMYPVAQPELLLHPPTVTGVTGRGRAEFELELGIRAATSWGEHFDPDAILREPHTTSPKAPSNLFTLASQPLRPDTCNPDIRLRMISSARTRHICVQTHQTHAI